MWFIWPVATYLDPPWGNPVRFVTEDRIVEVWALDRARPFVEFEPVPVTLAEWTGKPES